MRPRDLPPAYRFAVHVLRRPLMALTRREWTGQENLPRTGGFIVVANHVSEADPLYLAHFLHDAGREGYFLAKKELFDVPFVGWILTGAGQIPVHRNTTRAVDAFRDAIAAVEEGKAVVIYPEGTLTHDPEGWPMTGKTGAARVAVATGAPVIPIAVWLPGHTGRAQRKDRTVSRRSTARRMGRPRVRIVAGRPIDLADLAGHAPDRATLERVTSRIMRALTGLVAELRGAPAPDTIYDRRAEGRVPWPTDGEESS